MKENHRNRTGSFPMSPSAVTLPFPTSSESTSYHFGTMAGDTKRAKSVSFQTDMIPLQPMQSASTSPSSISGLQAGVAMSCQVIQTTKNNQYMLSQNQSSKMEGWRRYLKKCSKFNYYYVLFALIIDIYLTINMGYHWWSLFEELSKQNSRNSKAHQASTDSEAFTNNNLKSKNYEEENLKIKESSSESSTTSIVAGEDWPLICVLLFAVHIAASIGFIICCFINTGNYANDGVRIKFPTRCSKTSLNSITDPTTDSGNKK